jgi:apolipoprotein N-acyltransferase
VISAIHRYAPDNIKNIAISLACGAITPLGFAPHGIYLIPFISISILILQCKGSHKKHALLYGFLFGLGYFGYGVNWLHISINLFGGINLIGAYLITLILVLYLSIYPAIFSVLVSVLTRHSSLSYSHVLTIPAIWTLGEWIRSWLFTGFPWLNLGYSQTDSVLSGLAPLLGVFGISYLVVMIAVTIVLIYKSDKQSKAISIALIITVCVLAWLAEQKAWSENLYKSISVALIQGAVPQEIKWSPDMRLPTKQLYQDLTKAHLDADLIIWPEAAIPSYFHQEQAYISEIHSMLRTSNSILLTGMPVYDMQSAKFYNGAIYLSDKIEYYFKQHLVPFGEYLPLKWLLQPIVNTLNIPIADFSPGLDSSPVLRSDKFNIGISICYEDTFGNEVIKSLPEANILVNISNDAWFGDSLAPHQHLEMARMRAQETGRYLLRATNTGITAIIDNKGKILSRSPQFNESTLSANANLYTGQTPYSHFGNYPVILFCFISIISLLGFRKRKS